MKHIGLIFFLLSFSVLPVFGQLSNSELQVSEENAEKLPAPTETGVVNEENDGATQKQETQSEQNRRVVRIANDYALAADEVLTTLIMIAGNARLQGSVTGNMLVPRWQRCPNTGITDRWDARNRRWTGIGKHRRRSESPSEQSLGDGTRGSKTCHAPLYSLENR